MLAAGVVAAGPVVVAGGATWLPQPAWFGRYARTVQDADADSMLSTYRTLIRLRRDEPSLAADDLGAVEDAQGVEGAGVALLVHEGGLAARGCFLRCGDDVRAPG